MLISCGHVDMAGHSWDGPGRDAAGGVAITKIAVMVVAAKWVAAAIAIAAGHVR